MKTTLAIFFAFSFYLARAQEFITQGDSLEHPHFDHAIAMLRDQSYITAAGGIGNLQPLIFEGRLSPAFFLTGAKRKWALTLSPQVMARMEDKKSVPIKSPSYKIHFAVIRALSVNKGSLLRKWFYEQALFTFSIDHHSNGGDGHFYAYTPQGARTTTIDVENGSFTTNFGTASISSYQIKRQNNATNAFRYAKLLAELHCLNTDELNDLYGNYRIHMAWGAGGAWRSHGKRWTHFFQHSALELQTGWIAGKMNHASASDAGKRMWADARYTYSPEWFKEISFFVRYYRGQDYYNIYFSKSIYMVSFGITTNLMNLRQPMKVVGEARNKAAN